MAKTERQKTIQRLDNLFSEYIRKRAYHEASGCQRCKTGHSWDELQAAHCFTRGSYTTRWLPENALGICGGCHLYIDSHEGAKFALFREWVSPKDLEHLYVLAHMTSKASPVDYKMTEIYLKNSIKRLDGVLTF